MRRTLTILSMGLLSLTLLLPACTREKKITQIIQPPAATFVGSEACQACHAGIYTEFKKTGHPYKLVKAADAQLPGFYPFTQIPGTPPNGAGNWDTVAYVIGGFWWKARFVGNSGYIMTAGGKNQYNMATQQWSDYNKDIVLAYNCGPCHTTGYSATGNQDGRPGLVGTWAFPGVQCEACHGKGSQHAQDPQNYRMTIDRSANLCGECHIRGSAYLIPAKGGFVEHHEQYNELLASKKATFECVDCHDPHIGLHASNPTRTSAIKNKCETCHFEEAQAFQNSPIDEHPDVPLQCIDCHMAKTGKSAVNPNQYTGDVRSHIFSINTDSTAVMFTPDGKYANSYITLDFACLQCHVGKSKSWAAGYAGLIHPLTALASN